MLAHVQAGSRDLERAAEALASRLPEELGVYARLAYNYRWAWDPDGPAVFRDLDPDRWEKVAENPVKQLQEASTAGLQAAAHERGAAGAGRRGRGTRDRGPQPSHPRRPRDDRPADRVLLRRVRLPRLVPDLLGRPGRPRRRHPQGSVRPRVAAGRDRSALPPGLLPPADRQPRLAARVLGRHRPGPPARRARDRRRRGADHGRAEDRRDGRRRPDLARGHRPRAAVPARRRAARELPGRPLDHQPPVHRRRGHAPGPVHAARHRRRARAGGDGDRAEHRAPQRGARRVRRAGAGQARVQRPGLARRRAGGRQASAPSSPPTRPSRRATTPTRPIRSRRCSSTWPGRSASTRRRSSASAGRTPRRRPSRSA